MFQNHILFKTLSKSPDLHLVFDKPLSIELNIPVIGVKGLHCLNLFWYSLNNRVQYKPAILNKSRLFFSCPLLSYNFTLKHNTTDASMYPETNLTCQWDMYEYSRMTSLSVTINTLLSVNNQLLDRLA